MTFKQFLIVESLLLEDPRVPSWMTPQHIKVFIDEECHHAKDLMVTHIDMRFEDWNVEWMWKQHDAKTQKTAYTVGSPGVLSMGKPFPTVRPKETVIPFGNFSAPLADGTFINYDDATGKSSIDPKPKGNVIRKDWGRFAEMIDGNNVVKEPQYSRAERERLIDKIMAG